MIEAPYSLLVIGFLLSLYQAYRGFMFQWLRSDAPFTNWTKPQKVLLLALADAFTYFVTTASGLVSLYLCQKLSVRISDPPGIEVGTSALFVVLAIYGIFGVTGKLPYLIDQGKLLPPSLGGGK